MEQKKNAVTTVGSEDGLNLSVVGDTYRIVISGKQTEGAYALIDMMIPSGAGPGPHSHPDFHEGFYVLEGEIEFKTELETYTAKVGSFVNIPLGGVVHCFKNKTKTTAHLMCMVIPSGLEKFFEEIGKPVTPGAFLPPPPMDPDTQKRLQEIAKKYNMKVFPPDYLD